MMRRKLRHFAALIGIVVGLGAVATVARGDNAPTTVLIVDGSGSMWARLEPDNRAKIDILREKLTTVLQKPSSTRLGLVSFGHRRRGDCSDIEVLSPPDVARDSAIARLAKLNPTGPGPLTAALKVAIDATGGARPAQIVLIGDGADNCQPDTCAVASDIAKNAPGVTIHVVEIGVPAADRPRVACIADATHGRYFDVADSNALNSAVDEVAKLAMLSEGAPVSSAGASGATAPPPPAGASLRASAALVKGGAIVAVPLRWRIAKTGDSTAIVESEGSDVTAKLAAGSYDIEASLGPLKAHEQVTIEDGAPQSIIVALDGAHLKVRASAQKGGEPSPTAIVTISSGDAPVSIARGGVAELYLRPSSYSINVTDGIARASTSLTLGAGDDKPIDIALGTGRLELSAATGSDAVKLDDILYTVFEDDPESPDGRREVARSRAAEASFTLPAGTYYVSARSGAGDVRQRIAVGAGETVRRSLSLQLAPLKVATVIAGAKAKVDQGVLYRVDRLDGEEKRVARAIGPDLQLNLPPGKYRVSASLAAAHLSASQEVTLEGSKPVTTTLEIQGGEVTFRQPRGAEALIDVYWEVVDAHGMPVWRVAGREGKTLLAPGHYTVRIQSRGKQNAAEFDIRAGENQEIEIGLG